MSTIETLIYTLAEAQDETRESRHLINFLMRDRQIPTKQIGTAKVVDEAGLAMLKAAIAEYRAKPNPTKERRKRRIVVTS